jgi:hypothetical protein
VDRVDHQAAVAGHRVDLAHVERGERDLVDRGDPERPVRELVRGLVDPEPQRDRPAGQGVDRVHRLVEVDVVVDAVELEPDRARAGVTLGRGRPIRDQPVLERVAHLAVVVVVDVLVGVLGAALRPDRAAHRPDHADRGQPVHPAEKSPHRCLQWLSAV